jgi:hypothetical protein
MKKIARILTIALLAAAPAMSRAQSSLEMDPAYLPIDAALDLKAIQPTVNVNLPRFLLQDAVSELSGGTNDPLAGTGINLADLVKDIKLIRVVVIEAKETNRVALDKGVATLRKTLESKWTPIATVAEEDHVGVYALGDPSGEKMAGLAVLIHDKNDAVIANVVGHVSIAKVVKVASQMNKFPKDVLKKLMKAGNTEKDEKSQTEPEPEKPAK